VIALTLLLQDIKMDVHTDQSVKAVKRSLHTQLEGVVPKPSDQRWFFAGRLLSDKVTIGDCNIPPHFVVQVVLKEKEATEPTEAEIVPDADEAAQTSVNDSDATTNERRSSVDSLRTAKPKKRRSHSEPVQR
jgi:hypothetical protein